MSADTGAHTMTALDEKALAQSPVGELAHKCGAIARGLDGANWRLHIGPAIDALSEAATALLALQAENERLRQIAAAPSDKRNERADD